MKRYIDADRLREKIIDRLDLFRELSSDTISPIRIDECKQIIDIIDSLQQEQPTNTGTLCSELSDFLIRNDIPKEKAQFIANRIADIYGSKRYIDGLCDGLDVNEQEQSESSKGNFVFPNFLYARTEDNKTIDVSYAPQSLDAVEYIRNDSLQQEQESVAERFARIVRGNLIGIDKEVQHKFEQLYFEVTGNKMYGGYND